MKRVKLKYDELSNSLIIDDNLRITYRLLSLLFIVNLINSVIRIFKTNFNEMVFSDYLWLVIGSISIIGLIYQFQKKSTANKLELKEINFLKIKIIFGNERFSLHLTNGKQRDLIVAQNGTNVQDIKELVEKVGIKIVQN